MFTKKCSALIILMLFVIAAIAGDNKTGYTGVWKLNKEKTPAANSRLFLSKISFTLKKDSLYTIRTYENENGETYPFNENLTLDGKEYTIDVYNIPRKAKAHWSEKDGNLVIEAVTTFNGNSGEENFISNEVWKVDEGGNSLTVDYVNKLSAGEFKGSFSFIKGE